MKTYYIGDEGMIELKANESTLKMDWEISERCTKVKSFVWDAPNLSTLEIDGFSKIENCYIVRRQYDNFTDELSCSYIEHVIPVLRLVETGEVFHISFYKKKFHLYAIKEGFSRDNYFMPSLTEPNYFTVASKRKITDWVNYVRQTEVERSNYLRDAYEKNTELAKRFQEKYPNGNFQFAADGWCERFVIRNGILEWKYTAQEDGEYSRSHYIYLKDLPSTEDLLK